MQYKWIIAYNTNELFDNTNTIYTTQMKKLYAIQIKFIQ